MESIPSNIAPQSVSASWERSLAKSITGADDLARVVPVDTDAVSRVIQRYPMRINPYFLSRIIHSPALWRQAVPDIAEIADDDDFCADPLWENRQSPVPAVVHRYPDRVVFMVSGQCAVYCRHCMRKREVGWRPGPGPGSIDRGIAYIKKTGAIKEVILSGGDPLLLSDAGLYDILSRLRRIPHVRIMRIHTRVPCTFPRRLTKELARMLAGFHPLFVNIQFNHPDEITPEAVAACGLLADAGIPLGSQTVLLKGINDTAETMEQLMRGLLEIRVRPYYLHHGDPVKGTRHFRTGIATGLEIMRALRGRLSGIGVPAYMIDLPGGGGKIPLLPEYVIEKKDRSMAVINYEGKMYRYPDEMES